MSNYKAEVSADEAVSDNMKIYARSTIKRFFPCMVDGLKPVQRRILYTVGTSTSLTKCLSVMGDVSKIHPHGDASIHDAIAKLAQPFSNIIPLLFSEAGIGSYSGDPPSSPRYIDLHSSEFARDIFFNKVADSTLIYVPTETDIGKEPAYFIPVIPFALMSGSFGLATGFKSESVSLGLHDLCQLTMKYVELRSKDLQWQTKLGTLVRYLIPDFPCYTVLRNKDELISEYSKGNFNAPLILDGTLVINPNSIAFRSIAPGTTLLDLFIKFVDIQKSQKNSVLAQHTSAIDDFSGEAHGMTEGNIVLTLRRGENPFDILDQVKDLGKFTKTFKPSPFVVDRNDVMRECTPWDLLDAWYVARHGSVLGELKGRQVTMVLRHRQLSALIVVSEHVEELTKIMTSSITTEEAINKLVRRFNLTVYQATYLTTLQLKQITQHGRDELLKMKEDLTKQIQDLQKEFFRVPEKIIDAVKYIDEKYTQRYPRKCDVPYYNGTFCYKKNGFIQIYNVAEADKLLKTFGSEHSELSFFNSARVHVYAVKNGVVKDDYPVEHPKEMKATAVYCLAHTAKAVIRCKDGKGVLLDLGLIRAASNANCDLIPVAHSFVYITKQGILAHVQTKDFRSILDNVERIDPIEQNDIVVAHCNTAESNVVRFDRLTGDGKLSKIVVGTWKVLGVFDPNRQILMTVPDNFRSRCPVKHLYFPDIKKFLQPNSTIKVHLGRRMIEETALVPYSRKSEIWTPTK